MSQEEQPDTLLEETSSSPGWPDPDGEQPSGVPPSEFLFAYLQQRADSLSVTQSDLEDLLATEARVWILTRATDRGREILAEAPSWSVDTLGEIRSGYLLLLRVSHEEGQPPYHLRVPHPPSVHEDDIMSIVSAAVVRFQRKHSEEMRQRAHPLLISEINDTHALAVLYDDRYHMADGTAVSRHLVNDVGSNRPIGYWLNEATEKIIVDKPTGTIVDYSLKDEEALLATVTNEPADTDADPSDLSLSTRLRTQSHQIGIGLATVALAGLLLINVAPVSLSVSVANGIGLAAFGVLGGTMLHSDLTDG